MLVFQSLSAAVCAVSHLQQRRNSACLGDRVCVESTDDDALIAEENTATAADLVVAPRTVTRWAKRHKIVMVKVLNNKQ